MSKIHESQARVVAHLIRPKSPYNFQIQAASSTGTELYRDKPLFKRVLIYALATVGIVGLTIAISSEPMHLERLETIANQYSSLRSCTDRPYIDKLLFENHCTPK